MNKIHLFFIRYNKFATLGPGPGQSPVLCAPQHGPSRRLRRVNTFDAHNRVPVLPPPSPVIYVTRLRQRTWLPRALQIADAEKSRVCHFRTVLGSKTPGSTETTVTYPTHTLSISRRCDFSLAA